ncbi:hypothetical protein K6L05_03660 [Salinicoccus roseus]|uniref:hypothetical protein n=1 Tax=Salinicoccus roseus TaxID=45670 RepID=UPI001CA6BEAC|nr:hypothetical protein [Salinicoccus roseus]MBY8908881.1 hypothetical protein [Salinicoccus roseus]
MNITEVKQEAQQELQTAVTAVEQAQGELRAEVEEHEATVDMDTKTEGDLQDNINELKAEQEQAVEVSEAKELQKQVIEAEEDLKLTQQVNEKMQEKNKEKIGEAVEDLLKAVKQARTTFKKTDGVMLKNTSISTIEADAEQMKEPALTINNGGRYAKQTLLDFKIITNKDTRHRGNHLNAMDSTTELPYLFDKQVLRDHGVHSL